MTSTRKSKEKGSTEKAERHSLDALIEKYKEVAQLVEKEGKQYAIKLDQEANEDVTIKYRLVLRPTGRGIVHVLEILDATEERAAIQIPLVGRDWARVLNHADRVLTSLSIEKFREVSELLVELSERLKLGGRSSVTEVE
jgi:1,4-alpha-glucan branching enzyme